MVALRSQLALHRLDELRRELTDLALTLDRRGQPAAADVALAVASRLGEVAAECAEIAPRSAPSRSGAPRPTTGRQARPSP